MIHAALMGATSQSVIVSGLRSRSLPFTLWFFPYVGPVGCVCLLLQQRTSPS